MIVNGCTCEVTHRWSDVHQRDVRVVILADWECARHGDRAVTSGGGEW